MTARIVPAFLRPAVLERVAEGWPADRIAERLGEKYGVAADASDVLITLKQTNAERGEAKTMVREQMRAELPAILAELVLSARSARARHRAYRLAALSINN